MNFKKIFNNIFNELFGESPRDKYHFSLLSGGGNYNNANSSSVLMDTSTDSPTTPKEIFTSIDENLNTMKSIYNSLINSDVIIREFSCNIFNRKYSSFIIYLDGMTDSQIIKKEGWF